MAAVTTGAATSRDLTSWASSLGKVAFAGAVTGFALGGVGGRLAMMLLRLTSSDTVIGLQSDDGFTIGAITSETLFLLGVTTGLGLMAALVYAAGRSWFPRVWRPWIAAAFFGVIGGAELVSTTGVDFRLLTPAALAITLFAAIPTVAGFVMAWWIERWLASERVPRSTVAALWPLVAFLALGAVGIVLLALLLAGWAVGRALPWLSRIWWSRPVTWVGRAAVALLAATGALELADDATVILGR